MDSNLSHREAYMHFTCTKYSTYILLLFKYEKCSDRQKVYSQECGLSYLL